MYVNLGDKQNQETHWFALFNDKNTDVYNKSLSGTTYLKYKMMIRFSVDFILSPS